MKAGGDARPCNQSRRIEWLFHRQRWHYKNDVVKNNNPLLRRVNNPNKGVFSFTDGPLCFFIDSAALTFDVNAAKGDEDQET